MDQITPYLNEEELFAISSKKPTSNLIQAEQITAKCMTTCIVN